MKKRVKQVVLHASEHILTVASFNFIEDGILLLEINRMLRGGGYFAWAAQPVYKHEPLLEQQWEGE